MKCFLFECQLESGFSDDLPICSFQQNVVSWSRCGPAQCSNLKYSIYLFLTKGVGAFKWKGKKKKKERTATSVQVDEFAERLEETSPLNMDPGFSRKC